MKKIALFVVLLLISAVVTFKYSKSTTHQLFGEIVDRVDTNEKVVALTFDDGPTQGYTQRILKTLNDEDVTATFFLVGAALEKNPEEARLIAEAGHEVGNHSFSHQRMVFRSPSFIAGELERTDELIRQTGYAGPIHFRPPYGKKLFNLPRYLDKRGTVSITWDVAPESYGQDMGDADPVVERVLEQVRPGSIVLLHVMFKSRESSMEAAPRIIRGLKERGYRFVTVSEMLKYHQAG